MSTTTETVVVTPPAPRRRRRTVMAVVGVAVVVVVALVLTMVMTANARAAARTAEAEEDATALLAAHAAATTADGELSRVRDVASGEHAEVLTPLLEVAAHESLAGLDLSALTAAADAVREIGGRLDDRAPVPALEAPTELSEPVGPDEPAEWTEALAAAYRALPDAERAEIRAAVTRTVEQLERRAEDDGAETAALDSALTEARGAVDALVAAAAARAPELALEAELASEELLSAVIAAGEALAEGPEGPAAVEGLRTLTGAVEAAAEAHAAEKAAREQAEREAAERAARRSGSGSGSGGSWTDHVEYDPCLATMCTVSPWF